MASTDATAAAAEVAVAVLSNKEHVDDTSILTICVIGASGDLAKKKTFPSLFHLYDDHFLPQQTLQIIGYARSPYSDDQLRQRLRPYLLEQAQKNHRQEIVPTVAAIVPTRSSEERVDDFLQHVYYQSGTTYGDVQAYTEMIQRIRVFEDTHVTTHTAATTTTSTDTSIVPQQNRLYYFAIPPSTFAETAIAIHQTGLQDPKLGWTRLIVEKPFGHDLQSFEVLNTTLSTYFTEDHIYRIDHYLGKELVQNLTVMRFANIWLEKIWNNECIQSIILTFKEPFGTEGRGGYFDQYGIIRDILQNHLLQVLALLTMETPLALLGPQSGKAIRDAKVAVLNAITPITLNDVVLGQYRGYAGTYLCIYTYIYIML
jgi:glucose-6-phosphate 1-dehydrogenase